MTHTPPLDLLPPPSKPPFGRRTKARWSLNPQRKLLVFVHGFKGDAMTTWAGLPNQLCLENKVQGYDVILFGYNSVVQTADESANQLHRTLNSLLDEPLATVNRSLKAYDASLQRVSNWSYDQLVLVGHSLGACVIRQALLNQLENGNNSIWPRKTKLLWFAPAHCGARILRLLTLVTVGIPLGVAGLEGAAHFLSPSLKDLTEGSEFLNQLSDRARALNATYPELKAPLTFWAWKDKVALNKTFPGDVAPYEEIRGVNHISICKPEGASETVKRMLQELP